MKEDDETDVRHRRYKRTILKGTNCLQKDMGDNPCSLQLLNWFQTTVFFGIINDGSLMINTLSIIICFSCRNLFKIALSLFRTG